MPIYMIKRDGEDAKAVKASNKAQAINYISNGMFTAEPMTAEDVADYMGNGYVVENATVTVVVAVADSDDVMDTTPHSRMQPGEVVATE